MGYNWGLKITLIDLILSPEFNYFYVKIILFFIQKTIPLPDRILTK